MIEREMEDLLWDHPDRFWEKPLTQFKRQLSSGIGRSDLIFETPSGGLLVVEIKRGRLPRVGVDQLLDYFGAMKSKYPDRVVDLMVVANVIPMERRFACEKLQIRPCEIPEERFRVVARDFGYTFASEQAKDLPPVEPPAGPASATIAPGVESLRRSRENPDFGQAPETAWYGLSKIYRDALIRSTEASDNYHLAGFLLAAGAGLGKSVYLQDQYDVPVYPNFYTFIVGRDTWAGKDSAIDLTERLINEASPDVGWLYDVGTKQGLTVAIARARSEEGKKGSQSVIIRESDDILRYLFQRRSKPPTQMGRFLADLFESPGHLRDSTRHYPDRLGPPPCVSLVANGNASPFLEGWGNDKPEYYLGRCFMFVPGDPKGLISCPDEPSEMHWNYVVLKLQRAFQFWRAKGTTQLSLSEETARACADFQRSLPQGRRDEPFVSLAARYGGHVRRVAMVHAALDLNTRIEEAHAYAAVELCAYLARSLRKIFLADNKT